MNILDFIWPHVDKPAPSDKILEDMALKDDLKKIEVASWGENTASFLDEARRLRDIETARADTAEKKSQIYLAVLLPLIAILVSWSGSDTFNGIKDFDTWHGILGFILFVLGLIYGVGAFVSSFRALKVCAFNRVGVTDIVKSGSSEDPLGDLTKEILKSVRQDRQTVNYKVSFILVTQAFLYRMALLLLLAVALITFADSASDLFHALKKDLCGVC